LIEAFEVWPPPQRCEIQNARSILKSAARGETRSALARLHWTMPHKLCLPAEGKRRQPPIKMLIGTGETPRGGLSVMSLLAQRTSNAGSQCRLSEADSKSTQLSFRATIFCVGISWRLNAASSGVPSLPMDYFINAASCPHKTEGIVRVEFATELRG
jgi:hypothetical protein